MWKEILLFVKEVTYNLLKKKLIFLFHQGIWFVALRERERERESNFDNKYHNYQI